ncbi:ribonuclease HI family protein [Candidatus Nomurabacteria bacterium]|nr:ribonuclease HI family protein [Candidatus Nomurabacteria bacterium]
MTKIILQTDGGARGNPGPAGAGVVVLSETGEILKTAKKFLGERLTNNEAEYLALLFGLENLPSLIGERGEAEVVVRLDSELVVKQLNGDYKVKEPRLKELAQGVKDLSHIFSAVTFTHIPREENKLADKLANEAMDLLS